MSHMVDTMAYAGEVPWHGLGNSVTKGADIDTWINESGLIWSVLTANVAVRTGPVNDGDGKNTWKPAEGHRAIYRSDTGQLFHIASNRYKVVQPRDVLEFFRGLSESHGLTIETAGSLRTGAIVWALATNDQGLSIKGSDQIKPYLLLSTSMDGTQATKRKWIATRVVCNNTISVAWREEDERDVTVRHNTTFDVGRQRERFVADLEAWREFGRAAERLADTHVSKDQLDKLMLDWFGAPKDKDAELSWSNLTTQSSNVIRLVQRTMVTAPGQELATARGTAWGVLNGVTRYVDFAARAHNNDNRLVSAWFGKGDQLKSRAMRDLLALAA